MSGLTGQWFDVFKCGSRPDMSGEIKTITPEQIDEAIKKYDSKDPAPIVIGHPTLKAPAWGWISEFRRIGDLVQAKADQVIPEFEELVKKGMYKKRSISFNKDGTFRHIGFLGAAAPAVAGLREIQFSKCEEAITLNFSTKEFNEQNLSDQHTAPKSDSGNNAQLSKEQDSDSGNNAQPSKEQDSDSGNNAPPPIKDQDVAELKVRLEKLNQELNKVKEQAMKANTELELEKRNGRLAEFSAFADSLITTGKVKTDQKNTIVMLLEDLHGMNGQNYAKQKNAQAAFKDLLLGLPESRTSELYKHFAKPENKDIFLDIDPKETARKAREYQLTQEKAGNNISISDAVHHVVGGK